MDTRSFSTSLYRRKAVRLHSASRLKRQALKLPSMNESKSVSKQRPPLNSEGETGFFLTTVDGACSPREPECRSLTSRAPTLREKFESELIRKLQDQTPSHNSRVDTAISFYRKKKPDPEGHRQALVSAIQKNLWHVKEPCIDEVYSTVASKDNFYKNYKGRDSKHVAALNSLSPDHKFSKECLSHKTPPLPVLAYIRSSDLVLNRYKLNEGVCHGLSAALPTLQHLTHLHLDECGVSDEGGALLLQGIGSRSAVASFFYTKNTIGSRFVHALNWLQSSPIFVELNLSECKVTGVTQAQLIQNIYPLRTLRKLYIRGIGLSSLAMNEIRRLLRRRTLEELDLSNNKIPVDAATAFFTRLKRNRTLRYLNFAGNKLRADKNEAAACIAKAVSVHPHLMHLNLSHTQLSDSDVLLFTRALNKSSSLIGLHLSGNNVTASTLRLLIASIQGSEESSFQANSAETALHPLEHSYQPLHSRKDHPLLNVALKDRRGRKIVTHRENLVSLTTPSKTHEFSAGSRSQEYVIWRVLQYPSVANAQQWKLSDHCWVCEKWLFYSLEVPVQSLNLVATTEQLPNTKSSAEYSLKASFNSWEHIPMTLTEDSYLSVGLLLPPGRHYFWVHRHEALYRTAAITTANWEGFQVNELQIPLRSVPLPLVAKPEEPTVPMFVKSKSVFKDFIEDSDERRRKMFANDQKYYKLGRLFKKEEDMQQISSLLLKNYPDIKEIFDYLMAISNYPTITMLDFSRFCEETKMLDHRVNHSTIDRLFIATNFEVESLDENPDRELCRYEFLEILVRIAIVKYQDLKLTPLLSTQKLIQEHVFRYGTFSKAVQFRQQSLYTVEVNELLAINLRNLQTIFTRFKPKACRWLTMHSVRQLLGEIVQSLHEREVSKCFAFSKMSVLDENNSDGAYGKMVFVEFLEFLGRLANVLFPGEDSLTVKLEELLKQLCAKHKLLFRRPYVQEETKEDESDSD